MEPLPPDLISSLDLEGAFEREVRAVRNLLPPEPELSLVPEIAARVASETRNRLGSGMHVSRAIEVSARKSRHGLRPVPYVAISERTAYRALTEHALGVNAPPRGPDDWLQFTRGPAEYGDSLAPRSETRVGGKVTFADIFAFTRSPIRYIVKSDVTAFYRHVNHRKLGDELIIAGADYRTVGALTALLDELEAGPIGLPQLLEPSDALSEIYIDAVERRLKRLGYPVWRFNDDFRIACHTYTDALRAIEDLDRALRAVGLTLNEGKTTTPRFTSYYLDAMGLLVTDSGDVVAQDDVETLVVEYTGDFAADADSAMAFLAKFRAGADDEEFDLRDLGHLQAQQLRRALAALARAKDPRALPHLAELVRFVSELTSVAIRYIVSLHRARVPRTKLAATLDDLSSRALNEWQRIWIAHGYEAAGVLSLVRGRSERLDRLSRWQDDPGAPAARAYCSWILAKVGHVGIGEIKHAISDAPPAIEIYYAAAAAAAKADTKQISSIWPSGGLTAMIARGLPS